MDILAVVLPRSLRIVLRSRTRLEKMLSLECLAVIVLPLEGQRQNFSHSQALKAAADFKREWSAYNPI